MEILREIPLSVHHIISPLHISANKWLNARIQNVVSFLRKLISDAEANYKTTMNYHSGGCLPRISYEQ